MNSLLDNVKEFFVVSLNAMDLSKLSANLPQTQPLTEESVAQHQEDIALEFKNAARSVAALYRLSSQKQQFLRQMGYLNCIDDLLSVISQGGDVENWCLMKKIELSGKLDDDPPQKENSPPESQEKAQTVEPGKLPQDYEFKYSQPTDHEFHLSNPIMTVDHSSHFGKKGQRNVDHEKAEKVDKSDCMDEDTRESKRIKF